MAEGVVLFDQVSFTHPDHQGEGIRHLAPGQSRALQYAERGQVLHTDESDEDDLQIDEREMKRLVALGAVSDDPDSMDAQLAKSGQPPLSAQRRLPYTYLTSPGEAANAFKAQAAVAGGVSPRSKPQDLIKLALPDLKVMAQAFGYGELAAEEGVSKEQLIEALTGHADDATPLEESAAQEQTRDQAQLAARQHGGQDTEPGQFGTNVLAGGRDATTGELPSEETEEKPKARRRSKAQSSESE